jgi:hypothetical protein
MRRKDAARLQGMDAAIAVCVKWREGAEPGETTGWSGHRDAVAGRHAAGRYGAATV